MPFPFKDPTKIVLIANPEFTYRSTVINGHAMKIRNLKMFILDIEAPVNMYKQSVFNVLTSDLCRFIR